MPSCFERVLSFFTNIVKKEEFEWHFVSIRLPWMLRKEAEEDW
jgi:hypothetical protein